MKGCMKIYSLFLCRGIDFSGTNHYNISVAKQSGCSAVGSAPALGAGCREFEPLHSDQKDCNAVGIAVFFCDECLNQRHPASKAGSCFGHRIRPLPVADEGSMRWRSGQNRQRRNECPTILGTARGGVAEDAGSSSLFTPTKIKTMDFTPWSYFI